MGKWQEKTLGPVPWIFFWTKTASETTQGRRDPLPWWCRGGTFLAVVAKDRDFSTKKVKCGRHQEEYGFKQHKPAIWSGKLGKNWKSTMNHMCLSRKSGFLNIEKFGVYHHKPCFVLSTIGHDCQKHSPQEKYRCLLCPPKDFKMFHRLGSILNHP